MGKRRESLKSGRLLLLSFLPLLLLVRNPPPENPPSIFLSSLADLSKVQKGVANENGQGMTLGSFSSIAIGKIFTFPDRDEALPTLLNPSSL